MSQVIFQQLCNHGKPSTSTTQKTYCSSRMCWRKCEMRDIEHKGLFLCLLLDLNPLAFSLCSHCYPLFLQPFPLNIGHRHCSQRVPTAGHQPSNENSSPPSFLQQVLQMRHVYCTCCIPKWIQPELHCILNDRSISA